MMSLEKTNMYIIQVRATASTEHSDYPAGEMHAIMVFSAYAINDGPNIELVRQSLQENGWGKLEFIQYKKVSNNYFETLETDEVLRQSYLSAKENGISIVVYKDLIT